MKDSSKSNRAVIGLAIGLAIGSAVGLAYAPQPGTETRNKVFARLKWLLWSPKERYLYLWKKTCRV